MRGAFWETVGIVAFAACALVCLGGWILYIVELAGLQGFAARTFRLGPVILRGAIRGLPRLAAGAALDQASWRLRMADGELAVVRGRVSPFLAYRLLPWKGTVSWQADGALVEFRVPLGPLIFFAAWSLGWIVGWIGITLDDGMPLAPRALVLAAPLIAVVWVALSMRSARRCAGEVHAQLLWALSGTAGRAT